MSNIQFEFNVECNLTEALALAGDIVSEMGMTPTFIIYEGKKLRFDEDSALLVRRGGMTEQEYIAGNIEM